MGAQWGEYAWRECCPKGVDPLLAGKAVPPTPSLRRVGSAGRGPGPGICFRFHDASASVRACFAIAESPGSRLKSMAGIRMSRVAATRDESSTDDSESRPRSASGVCVDAVGGNAEDGRDVFGQHRGEHFDALVGGQGEQFGAEGEGAIVEVGGEVAEPGRGLRCRLRR